MHSYKNELHVLVQVVLKTFTFFQLWTSWYLSVSFHPLFSFCYLFLKIERKFLDGDLSMLWPLTYRNYKVQLVALSDNSFYRDSAFSNTLLVSTSPHSPRLLAGEDMVREDQDMIPVKVTAVTETSIQLDWSNFLETEGVVGYKIQWSSVAQPAVCT